MASMQCYEIREKDCYDVSRRDHGQSPHHLLKNPSHGSGQTQNHHGFGGLLGPHHKGHDEPKAHGHGVGGFLGNLMGHKDQHHDVHGHKNESSHGVMGMGRHKTEKKHKDGKRTERKEKSMHKKKGRSGNSSCSDSNSSSDSD